MLFAIKREKRKILTGFKKFPISLYLLILAMIFGTIIYYLILNLFVNITDFLLLCAGSLFGIVGSILSNVFSAAFDRHIDSQIEDKCWLNKDGRVMLVMGISLALFLIYLLALFVRVVYF
jgi:hypothetical protein